MKSKLRILVYCIFIYILTVIVLRYNQRSFNVFMNEEVPCKCEGLSDASPQRNQRNVVMSLRMPKEEQTIRDAVEMWHSKNFIKPPKESCQKRLPSVIVIGVQKCGTRELIDFMHLHPHIQIYNKGFYEMMYFDKDQYYKSGAPWLKEQMPCSYSNQITVMKNAGYFHRKYVPQRIQEFNKSIKLILLVREPISRLLSAYTYFSKDSERGRSFSDFAIDSKSNKLRMQYQLGMSVYDESMALWLKYFDLSQFLIIESSELKNDPVSTLKTVETFLGVGHYITSDMFVYNADKGFYCVRSNLTLTEMACYAETRGRSQEDIPQKTLLTLKKYFKPRNERFFELIGQSFDW